MKFSASLDKTAKYLSLFISLFVVTTLMVAFMVSEDKQTFFIVGPIVSVSIFLAYLWKPNSYEITPEHVIVNRLIGKAKYERSRIINVRAGEPEEIKNAIRLFGSGGMFGYFGKFRNSHLKTFVLQCTRRDHLV
ncbi:MAG: PH domain-containing protein, partial [Chitinophagaceae bacterium]